MVVVVVERVIPIHSSFARTWSLKPVERCRIFYPDFDADQAERPLSAGGRGFPAAPQEPHLCPRLKRNTRRGAKSLA